jgi:hypothetical protein
MIYISPVVEVVSLGAAKHQLGNETKARSLGMRVRKASIKSQEYMSNNSYQRKKMH